MGDIRWNKLNFFLRPNPSIIILQSRQYRMITRMRELENARFDDNANKRRVNGKVPVKCVLKSRQKKKKKIY
jgi:hypothetical protein